MDLKWLFGYRLGGYERRREVVESALAFGDRALAAELLWKQERAWGLNWSNGSPASMVVDYEHLIWVLEQLREVVPGLAEAVDAAISPAKGLRDLNVMRVGHSPYRRMMSREAAVKLVRLQDELKGARAALWSLRGVVSRPSGP